MLNTNADRNEQLSANLDGEELQNLHELSHEDQKHLKNWAMIGAAMRGELAEKVDMNFADRIMAEISRTETAEPLEDQSQVEQQPVIKRFFNFNLKKLGFVAAQTAVAASICMVTVFGYQTWMAEDNMALGDPAAVTTMGPVGGVNLASYQNRTNPDHAIMLDQTQNNGMQRQLTTREQRELAQKREQEAERINNYLKGYVLNTASNN